MRAVCLLIAVEMFASAALAGPNRLALPAAKPASSGKAFRSDFLALREDLRKYAYEGSSGDRFPKFSPWLKDFSSSLLRCFDEEDARPNPEKFHQCLGDAERKRFEKIFALGYPNNRRALCEAAPAAAAKAPRPGAQAYELLGEAETYLRESRDEEAHRALDEAIAVVEADGVVTPGVAFCRGDDKSWARLLRQLPEPKSVVAVEVPYCRALLRRAELLAKLKKWEDALADLDRLMRFSPENTEAFETRGAVLIELSRSTEAERTLRRGLTLTQELGEPAARRAAFYALLSVVSRKNNNLKEASEFASQATALDPGNGKYRDELQYVRTLLNSRKE